MTDTGYESYFPKESPYPNQSDAMERIHDAVEEGRDVVFEGACGTGKTLSALVPSLEHARREDRTVVITTNVHQQMRQFVEEAREIKELHDITVSVFRGKSSMCHIDVGYDECEALRDNTYDLVELEDELDELRQEAASGSGVEPDVEERIEAIESTVEEMHENGRVCDHFHSNVTESNESFFDWLDSGVRSPDEVYDRADSVGKCGYELLKEGMESVDVVICNYHHLLSPEIRDYFFDWLDRSSDEVIGIFDEAHNLEDAAREHSSRTLTQETLERAELELAEEGREAEEAREVVEAFREAVENAVEGKLDFGQAERLGNDWEDVTVELDEGDDYPDEVTRKLYSGSVHEGDEVTRRVREGMKLASRLDRRYEREYKSGDADKRKECPSLSVFSFIRDYLEKADEPGYLPIAGVRRSQDGDGVETRLELYTCIPREVTGDLFDSLHSSVLMSATLRPFDVLESVLGLDEAVELSYGLEYPEENRETFAVDLPPLFSRNRDDPSVVSSYSGFLHDVIEHSAGNVLVFFPSYAEAERYYGELSDETSAELLLDEVGESAESLRSELGGSDAKKVVLTYLWGTLTEGVDFPDDVARTAVVVGVGYPYLSQRKRAVQDAYEDEFGDGTGWKYAVEAPTIRKTRQALGRILRSPDDYGVRILADARYSPSSDVSAGKYGVFDSFPEEERDEFVEVDSDKVRYALYNFWERLGVDTEEEGIDVG